MPSGKVHDSISVLSIIPVFLCGHYIFHLDLIGNLIFTVSAIFSQLMFGPDLDTRTRQYKRWGIFKWLWLPYRILMPHRSKFSHGLLWGPIFRCLYVSGIIIILFILSNQLIYAHTGINTAHYLLSKTVHLLSYFKLTFLIAFIVGMFLGNAIHTITDKLYSFFKNLI